MHRPAALWPSLFLLLLVACGRAPAPTLEAGDPSADGQQFPWSSRLDAPVDDPYAAGRDYAWVGPTSATGLNAQALNIGNNALSDLTWTSATNSWGPIEKDRSNGEKAAGDGRTLTIGGQTFQKGLGMHARAEVRYALNGQCSTFSASLGIDDEVGDRGSVVFQVYGDGTKLYDSGVVTGTALAKSMSVKIGAVRELRLVVEGGDSISSDHADWANPTVSCTATAPVGSVALNDLPYTSATNGWGPVEINTSNGDQGANDGRTLTIAGETFPRGLGVHSRSTLTYYLGGNCTTFAANIGVDDEVGNRGSVTFEVYGDSNRLHASPVMRGTDGTVYTSVGVTGVQVLKLVVTDGGDGVSYDHADWANAGLLCTPPPAPDGVLRVFLSSFEDFVCTQDTTCPLRVTVSREGAVAGDATVTITNLPAGVTGPLKIVVPATSEVASVDIGYTVASDAPLGLPKEVTFTATAGGFTGAARTLMSIESIHGTFDPAFPITGLRFNDVSAAHRLVVQPDGKVIVAGSAYQENVTRADDLVLARYHPDGSLDASFGAGGTAVLDGGAFESSPFLKLLPDGRILVSATQTSPSVGQILIWRLTPDGRVDSTFGTQGRTALSASGVGTIGGGLEVQADGKIVVGGLRGLSTLSLFVARLNPAGALDPTFGTGGVVLHSVSDLHQETPALALEPDGRIMLGYTSSVWTGQTSLPAMGLARLKPNGVADTTWNGTGFLTLTSPRASELTDIARQPDGRWLATGGMANPISRFFDFFVARFDVSGRLDPSFGAGGVVQTNFQAFPTTGWAPDVASGNRASRVLLQNDGKIIVAGQGCQADRLASARYLPTGQLDVTWGVAGRSCLALGGYRSWASDIALDGQGRIWAATPVFGRDTGSTRVFVVTRIRP